MFRRRYSLIWRIAPPFALLLILAMGSLSLYLSSYFRQSYLNISEQKLQADARLTADEFSLAWSPEPDPAAINAMANRYANLLGVRVTIINSSGTVLGESQANPQEMENHLNRPEIQRALGGSISTETRYSSTLQKNMLYVAAPIVMADKVVGAARLSISLDSIQANLNRIEATVMAATAITLALALLLSFLIARYTVSPLKQLARSVGQIAEGDLSEVPSTTRRDEIGLLDFTFQAMAQQLKNQIEELQAERGTLQSVLANMTDGIIIVDADGIVQLVNLAARRMFQSEDSTGAGNTLIEVVRHHQLVELWRKSRISGMQETATLETTPDRAFVQGIATPISSSLPGQTLLLLQDLTRVRRLETVRRDFVSNVSHELRTPLASLKALVETLEEGALEDPPAARRFLQRMNTEIDNLTQMVHELLELSRIESNRVPLQMRPVQVCDLLNPAAERMQLQAERAGLSIQLDCPSSLPSVRADSERIAQVLINLIHNAVKFTPPGGAITIGAYENGKDVVIFVRDTGVGIAAEALSRIFERFYKADRSRSGGGTGLGLSIARHMIEAHGGRIWAESEINKGSTFYFSLPAL